MFNDSQVMISLVLATVYRTVQLDRFLESLAGQSYKNFELIIIDQNSDDRLIPIIEKYQTQLQILHFHSSIGLSKSRNLGLSKIRGDIVAFPDDDCWYSPDLLLNVAEIIAQNEDWSGITGRAGLDRKGKSQWRWDTEEGWVTRNNVWTRGISISVFLEKEVITRVGEFDETLGAGSGTPWGSGEETDYLIRAIDQGFKIWYDPSLIVFHEDCIPEYTKDDMSRAFLYGAGMGRVLKKHQYPLSTVGYFIIRPLITSAFAIICGNFKRALYFLKTIKGRANGWCKYKV